jgi:hypothetical protein
VNTVFFDRTCGKKLPQSLKLLGLSIEIHDDHFAQSTDDDVWLAEVGDRGWFVVTNDKRIMTNQAERQALISHGVGCFVLWSGERRRFDQARILMRAWDRMQMTMDTLPRPFIVRILGDGRLDQLHPPRS